jgi:hypothetical protein
MNTMISNPTSDGWGFECFGPNGSPVLTNSQAEALFWHSLGYVVLHVSHWAL